ncbi:ABC-2 family transporter protein [Frankineae bacterium MT45]|nr:ABC-2 family transporter protein [Frankineae bacterium MT45]
MGRLIRSEGRKLRSTQLWFWMLVAVIALTALSVIGRMISDTHDGTFAPSDIRDIFLSGQSAFIGSLVLGVLAVTAEFRYQTITPTLLATPSRVRVVSAKLAAYALVGAAYSIIAIVVSCAIALPWLSAKNVSVSLTDDHLISAFAGVLFSVTLWGLVGLGFGALVRNQIVAMVVAIIYVIIVEPILSIIPYVRNVYPYLPGGASAAILDTTSRAGTTGDNHYTLLSPALGCLVLLAWALGLSIIGATLSMNRDIT